MDAPQTQAETEAPPAGGDRDQEVQRLSAELAETRKALAETERQLLELRASRSAEMARLERQAHWVERSRIDLDRLMNRPSVKLLVRLRSLALRVRGFVRALLRR